LQVYLSVTPPFVSAALRHHRRLAHVAYRIGENGRLQRSASLYATTPGSLLSLSDAHGACVMSARTEPLCRDILRECCERSFAGVLGDFESPPSGQSVSFCNTLGPLLRKNSRCLYLPERWAMHVPSSVALICTALSGGTYRQKLKESAGRFPADRLALDVERVTMDFTLPSPDGQGCPLTPAAFADLRRQLSPAVYYSKDLAARYFTYTRSGETHFVLFDDEGTIREKIRIGAQMGYRAAFLMYPEVEDLLPRLFPLHL